MAKVPPPQQGEGRQAYLQRLLGAGFEVSAFEGSIPDIGRGETFTPSGDYPLRPGVLGVGQAGGPQIPVPTETAQQLLERSTRVATEAARVAGLPAFQPGYTSISSPITTPSVSGVAPTLPVPSAPSIQESFILSATQIAANAKTRLEDELKRERDEANKRTEQLYLRLQDLTSQTDPTKDPTYVQRQRILQDQLNAAEASSKTITENFEANKKYINELDSLLTEGNALIQQMKGVTGLASIRNPRINQAIEAVNARASVIQAGLAARNGQIAQAHNIINNAFSVATADRNDRLNYFNALIKLEQGKLLDLGKNEKEYIGSQIKLLEGELKLAESNADAWKKVLEDPDMASALLEAGATLNTPPEQYPAFIAKAAYINEVRDNSNDMAERGFTFLAPGQKAPTGMEVQTTIDTRGVEKQYYKPTKKKEELETTGSTTLQRLLQGVGSIADLTPSEKQKIQNEAFEAGLFDETPPDWFKESVEQETQSSITSELLKQLWDEYRAPLKATSKATSSIGTEVENPFR